jgi:DNA polymerase I-like protein with 3'-5' exonuclease and polymerase domains
MGFFNVLLKLMRDLGFRTPGEARVSAQAPCIAVAFDLRAPTFRHEKFNGYKKRRKGMPEELAVQMPYVKEILDLMGIARVEAEGYEADDIIGTLAQAHGEAQVYIATGDRDSFQLITERVSVCLASTKDEITYTPEKIAEVYGITPAQLIEVKALMGDSSDDIPGVSGIGEKTALKLIAEFGSIDYIYENLPDLKIAAGTKAKLEQGREMCFLSRELGTIATDAPVELSLDEYKIGEGNPARLAELLSELEIFSLMKKLQLQPVPVKIIVPEVSPRVAEIEAKIEPVLRDMERAGIKADADGITRFGEELTPLIADLERRICEIAGEPFNVGSPKQLGEILFDRLGLPHGKRTKTGYSTNTDVLESLYDTHEIIPLITEYRALTKLNSTYVRGLLEHIAEDGRIHTTFKNETQTGRLSSTEPNIQNIPVRTPRGRVMRRFFVAEQGKMLVGADYSQIELRVLAHIAKDSAMSEAFGRGADIHAITAEQVFGDSKMRSAAKAVNFGIVYGMGAFSLSKEIGVSVAEAKDYIERYLDKYSGVREYLSETVEAAKRDGYVKTALGRVRRIPEIQATNKMTVAAGERIAKNTPIQGTAADIIKIAMIRVHERLKNATLILQIHDELIAEAPAEFAEETAAILREEMVGAGRELGIELTVEVGTGRSWYEIH